MIETTLDYTKSKEKKKNQYMKDIAIIERW